ncbi:MAG: DUF2855 family protein [bacterium]|nr:DUF2855 family protein [bacterium]
MSSDFLVDRAEWRRCRVIDAAPEPAPGPGQVLLRVDRFALTANNVTYAVIGDMLGYWRFFPADDGWGRIPVMGFGDVLASRHADVRAGERVFGFFPMATHLLVDAGDADAAKFADLAPHRADTAPVYRQYLRTTTDALYDPAREDQLLLLRGLFMTSFLVDDFLGDNGGFGARTFVVSSASSKTAIALAAQLRRHRRGRVIGLTSARNADFVRGLPYYDGVVEYDAIATLPADEPIVFVDHSGDRAVVDTLHRHVGDNLRHSAVVGATHWQGRRPSRDLPGAPPTFFFAPAQIEKRTREWGPAGLEERLGDAWRAFVASSDAWLEVVRGYGPAAVERAYREVLEGQARPEQGHVLSMWDEGTR